MPEGRVLEFNRVTKRFGSVTAVSDLSVRVEPGRVTGFLGPNGAGKTTSLRMMLGQIRPSEGTVTIGGQSYAELRQPLRIVGSVLEETVFRPRRTAQRQLMIAAKANGIPAERVDEVLNLVGLRDDAETRLGSYSLGMRQRFAVAGALLGDPGVLVLDEPANGLDPEGIRWMRLLMRRLADEGRTVLLSSHVLSEIEQVADDVVVLSKGNAVYAGGIDELANPTGGAVIVDAVNRAQLITALSSAKLEFDVLRSGVTVRNSDSATVGAITAEAGVPLTTLQQRGPSLEEVFLDLIHGRRDGSPRAAEAAPVAAPVADAVDESVDADPDAGVTDAGAEPADADAAVAGAGAFAASAGAVGAGALGAASLFGPTADANASADAADGSADLVDRAADANDDPDGSPEVEGVEDAVAGDDVADVNDAATADAEGAETLGDVEAPVADEAAIGSAELTEDAADANDDPDGAAVVEDAEVSEAGDAEASQETDAAAEGIDSADADATDVDAQIDADVAADTIDIDDQVDADSTDSDSQVDADAAAADADIDADAAGAEADAADVTDADAATTDVDAQADADATDSDVDSTDIDAQIDADVAVADAEINADTANIDAQIDADAAAADADIDADVAVADADTTDVDDQVDADVTNADATSIDAEIDADAADADTDTEIAEAYGEGAHDAPQPNDTESQDDSPVEAVSTDDAPADDESSEPEHEDGAEVVAGLFGDAADTSAEADADSPATEADATEAGSDATEEAEQPQRAGNPFLSRLFGRGAPATPATTPDGFAQDEAERAEEPTTADAPTPAAETVDGGEAAEAASETDHSATDEIYAEPASDASIAALWAPRSAASALDTDDVAEDRAETDATSPEEPADAPKDNDEPQDTDDATRPLVLPLATESVTIPTSTEQPTFTELITGLPASVAEGIGEQTAATEAIPVFTGLSSDDDEDSAVDDDEDPRLAAMRTSLSSAASRFFNGPAPDYPYSRKPKEEPTDESDSADDKPDND